MKSKTVMFFLWFFLGLFGAHRFYVEKIGSGILYFFTGGLFFIGWFIDLFSLGTMVDNYNLLHRGMGMAPNVNNNTNQNNNNIVINMPGMPQYPQQVYGPQPYTQQPGYNQPPLPPQQPSSQQPRYNQPPFPPQQPSSQQPDYAQGQPGNNQLACNN